MNKNFIGLCAIGLACMHVVAQQQKDSTKTHYLDEVVVSDSRFELKRENSGKTVIKITADELERNQGRTIAEIINTRSGIEIVGSRGRKGAIYGVYARGGRGRQVLVLIDGVRVSDPSSSSQEYDLRLLPISNIESVEIIKGAASTLYGTNAATAVINITTKKVSRERIALNVLSSMGTNQTANNQNYNISDFSNSAQLNGTLGKLNYLASFSNQYSNGLSAIVTPENIEDDYSNFSSDIKVGYEFTDNFKIAVYGNHTKLRTQFDESFGLVDAPYQFLSEQKRAGLSSEYTYEKGSIHFNGAYTSYVSESQSAFPNKYEGDNLVFDVYNKYIFNDSFHTIAGINYLIDESEFEVVKDFTITDPYVNMVYVSPFGLNLNVGGRLNNHSEYGARLVYNVNPSYTHKLESGYVKVLGSYATSYITPSLTQLFGFFGANPNLEPEENITIEGGLEFVNNGVRMSTLYFNRDENQPIIYGLNGYENIEGFIDAQGAEVELDWNLLETLKWSANYTFTERKGDNAIRIPKHKINTSLGYKLSDKTHASIAYSYTGNRLDTDFNTFTDVALSPFSLLDFSINHTIIPNKLNVFLFANNLLNEEYLEIIGFTTKGRNFRIGMNLSL
ncbi:vitamin B12 transporter [Saonia flava]|uniref:Vitamin B12 transporter n=1 Tax=Saonia flava TaxID=523696 RepID=A0A846R5F3_9FLAO|nr:TonB-dependent receptor plug domain-containing protein [Saonia flava]NJB72009.1 vitamin B12 transporter [Saonia flava]